MENTLLGTVCLVATDWKNTVVRKPTAIRILASSVQMSAEILISRDRIC